ncbi:MAG: hypothetical protein EXR67_06690 [Dehalococcoidia bacterium]|nr:hypothetical protein [Dehalococcoidia bacterium]
MRQGYKGSTHTNGHKQDPTLTTESVQALEHLRSGVAAGRPWHIVLLEAISMWTSPREVVDGKRVQYLIYGEAFDVLALAQRLGEEILDFIPAPEWRQFRLHGRFPRELAEDDFQHILGEAKLKGLLNYWYGVALEGALQSAVRDEIRKDRANVGLKSQTGLIEQTFIRIYGSPRTLLMQQYREKYQPEHEGALEPWQRKEFTYWLFRLRVDLCEKERVASDTLKAMLWLQRKHPEPLLGLLPGLVIMEAEAIG